MSEFTKESAAACDAEHLDQSTTTVRRNQLLPARTVEGLAETFRALGDPTRVRILDALAGGELCVCDIAALINISESGVSHQLRLLRGMRLVRPRRAGRLVYYSVDDHHILELLRQAMTHVEEQATPATVIEEQAAPATVIEEQAAPATVIEEQATPATVIEEQATPATVIEERATPATVVEEEHR